VFAFGSSDFAYCFAPFALELVDAFFTTSTA